jgi:superfamily II DNA/RNA helicase/HKD family nuclease
MTQVHKFLIISEYNGQEEEKNRMPLIDNKNQTLQEALKNALSTTDSVDIAVGFFFFSGFEALANELKDKKVRILVGLELDPDLIPQIAQLSKEGDVDLTKWQPRMSTASHTALQENYINALIGFINDSDIFDHKASNQAFDIFIEKIENGSLEIRKTLKDFHGKMYLLHNKAEFSQGGDFPGTVFMGSNNFTYRGLIGQGELNFSTREEHDFEEYQSKFNALWSDSESISIVDMHRKEDFLRELKPKIWKFAVPSPYEIYIRILDEMFRREEGEKVKTPSAITNGLYTDLEYQIDAIKMVIDRLNRYDGAILADVVGLGKSVIASAVARNMDMKTVIIAPPHLRSQWEDYKESFGIRGSVVFSSGKVKDVYERYRETREPFLLVLDEAHRFRNEDTTDYKYLHQVCRSHPDNKVLLLTATPFNNDPKDVFALVKLFQTPGQSTIRSVDNLSIRYRELIQKYKALRRVMRKGADQEYIDRETEQIAREQRRLIEPVLIRRSRLDLKYITRYREDLERQNVAFSEVIGPELLEYNLGKLFELYSETLELITKDEDGFIGARYKPTSLTYMSEENQQKFFEKYKKDYDDIEDLRIAQTNLAKFMKRLLVMRFESSKAAFKATLEKMIEANKIILNWWEIQSVVPVFKKGELPDPIEYEEDMFGDAFDKELEDLRGRGLIEIEKELLDPIFIEHVKHDIELLEGIHQRWFSNPDIQDLDPKLDNIVEKIKSSLNEQPDRKIVIFSTYKDTVDYLYDQLQSRGISRVMRYTASEGNETYKDVVKANFDASYPEEKQKNEYDVLVATDALSEGFNLHRAGIIINYDIPYNPTRVIQRIGRINRINKKVFDNLYVYNSFPTVIGEESTRIKSISTLKIKLINAVVGSDTRTLTSDEELKSFFKDEFEAAEQMNEKLSWDAIHRENYEKAKKYPDIMERIRKLPRRTRIKRLDRPQKGVLVFGKKGENSVFTYGENIESVEVVSSEYALPIFLSKEDEQSVEVDSNFSDSFNYAKEKLFEKSKLPKIQGRRAESIKILELLGNELPQSKEYCDDIKNIIKTYDDINEGTLKDITKINLADFTKAYKKLQIIVPKSYIDNIFQKVEKTDKASELLLFAEQLT